MVEQARRTFCADLLHTQSISEAYSLVVVGAYIVVVNANPTAAPGTGPIGTAMLATNIAIQLFDELFVTDFIVAWLSSRFPKRYVIDLVQELSQSSKSQYYLILATIALSPGWLLGYASSNLYFTSPAWLEGENDWTLTSCPTQYFEPVEDMIRIAPEFMKARLV